MEDKELILVDIESNFAGEYRLEYDGKYVTLYGLDNNYKMPCYGKPDEYYIEEMVLHPCVFEGRGLSPEIINITDKHIIIKLK